VRDVIVLADGDDPGEAAAQACAWRWKREGRRVRIARPPRGLDFNDLLVRPAPLAEEVVRAESWNPTYTALGFNADDVNPPFLAPAVEELVNSDGLG
jgi:hypothetical protein